MILALYFFRRFFKYLFLINFSLTLLFNFIEFFEKLVRVKHATITMILHFIALNIPSSFFDTLPLSSWLAACLLIKEFAQQNEWEILQILNINYKKLFNLFLLAGAITASISFIGKEKLTLGLLNKTEKFKLEKLKQKPQHKIINKWLVLSQNNFFCYFNCLDLETDKGNGLTLLYLTPDFEIEKIISSPIFHIHPQTQDLYLPEGTITKIQNNTQIKIKDLYLKIPTFFSQLQLNISVPSLSFLTKNLILWKNILPVEIWNDLLAHLLKRIFLHLHIILYPILTFLLFLLCPFHPRYKWLLIMLPYPIITIINILMNFMVQKGIPAYITIFPYLLLIIIIFSFKIKLEKSS